MNFIWNEDYMVIRKKMIIYLCYLMLCSDKQRCVIVFFLQSIGFISPEKGKSYRYLV